MTGVHGLGLFRSFRPTVLVAALATMFGTVLVLAPDVVGSALHATHFDDIASVKTILGVIGWAFLAVAIYVAAIVTANTCATIIAGQTRLLALQRLIGASGASLRRRITRSGLAVGVLGGVLGAAAGVALTTLTVQLLRHSGFLPDVHYPIVSSAVILPVLAVVLTTWGAFGAGSRNVLSVTPLQALSSVVEPTAADLRAGRGRTVAAIVLLAVGALLMGAGVALSGTGSAAVLPAILGGAVSFSGVVVGASLVMPPILAVLGKIGSHDPVVLLASRNALRAPVRASRAVIGLVIGVTLLVMFSVALAITQHVASVSLRAAIGGVHASADAINAQNTFFEQTAGVVNGLVGFSAIIAAVGVINALALGVLQRRRELGLLRVLGFTAAQVRRMILVEAVQMVAAGAVFGIALGVLYGWVAAVTLLGTMQIAITPILPFGTIMLVVGGALVLAIVATIAPVRSAMRVPPTQALAVR